MKYNLTISGAAAMIAREAAKLGHEALATKVGPDEIVGGWSIMAPKQANRWGNRPSGVARAKRIAKRRKNIRARGSKK